MYDELEFSKIHRWLLCPRKHWLAYRLLDGWYENGSLNYFGDRSTLWRLFFELILVFPNIFLLLSIPACHFMFGKNFSRILEVDYLLILGGVLISICIHQIVWGKIKNYLKTLRSYCLGKETTTSFLLETNKFCIIHKNDAAFLGIIIGVLASFTISLISLEVISIIGVQNSDFIKEYLSLCFSTTFFSSLMSVTYSQYRFFNYLSAELESIIASNNSNRTVYVTVDDKKQFKIDIADSPIEKS